jgi:DNA processing protein
MSPTDEVYRARAYLLAVAEPPAPGLSALIASCGPVEAAARVRAGELPARVGNETSARRDQDRVDDDFAAAEKVGGRLVVPEDDDWPVWQFHALAQACERGLRWSGVPIALWVRGSASLAAVADRAVSVVGVRAATSYGEHIATELSYGLATEDVTVVSGAAYGIDGAAHRGALAAEGRTVAVLGCGIDVGYPAGHTSLLDRIIRDGLVISEYPPGTPPARYRFLVRNRLIAALSAATVVVEAGIRSGARNTAGFATALGKELMAVPGPITSVMSAGCHELIRTGSAIPVGSVAEILESVGPIGENLAPRLSAAARPTDVLTGQALRVHEALDRKSGRGFDRISVDSGVPLDRVRALLPELELTGLVERVEDGWRATS